MVLNVEIIMYIGCMEPSKLLGVWGWGGGLYVAHTII